MNFNFPGGSVVSLDIGTAAVRIAELKHKKGGRSSLLHYASLQAPAQQGAVQAMMPDDITIGLIKQAINDAGISKKEVFIGIPTDKTFSVVVDLPKIEKREDQKKVIPIQAEEHIPSAIDTVDLDWHILGDSPVEQGKMEVLLTSVDKSYNARRIKLVEDAGLSVVSIEPDVYALPKALVRYGSDKTHIILESGNVATDIVVVINGSPRLVRTIPIGAQYIVSEVAKHMKIDMAQAQAMAYKFGLVKNAQQGQVYEGVAKGAQPIIDEVQKSVKYIYGRYGEVQFADVLVSGFSAFLPGLCEHIQATVKIPTVLGDAWTNVDYPQEQKPKLDAEKSIFSVAVGLSRRIDD